MKVKFVGPRARIVAPAYSESFRVEPGEIVEVDDDLGNSLLEQSEKWERPAATKEKEAVDG